MSSKRLKQKVVIVGAGMSGLGCGRELRLNNVNDFVVLEAQSRIGGRVFPSVELDNIEMELGAEFIHGDGTILHEFSRELGWKLRQICIWAHGDGGPGEAEAPDGGAAYYYVGNDGKYMRFNELDEDLENLTNELDQLRHVRNANKDDDLMSYLSQRGVSRRAVAMAEAGYANTLGASLQHLSLSLTCRLENLWDDDGSDVDFRFVPSSRILLEKLISDVGAERIHTSCQVLKITEQHDCLIVEYCNNGQNYSIEAERVVVTVPVRSLQNFNKEESITFIPSLPRDKITAINGIGMRGALKIVAQFNKRFWPEDMHGTICSDCRIPEFWAKDAGGLVDGFGKPLSSKSEEPPLVLVGYAMAGFAANLNCYNEEQILTIFLNQLDTIFGGRESRPASNAFVKGFVFDWEKVPFIRGGYSFPSITESPDARKLYSRPEYSEKLFFAGEASDAKGAFMTMHSAIRTGKAAAHNILLAKKKPKL